MVTYKSVFMKTNAVVHTEANNQDSSSVLSKDSNTDGEMGKSWTFLACLRYEEQQFSVAATITLGFLSLEFLTGVIGL